MLKSYDALASLELGPVLVLKRGSNDLTNGWFYHRNDRRTDIFPIIILQGLLEVAQLYAKLLLLLQPTDHMKLQDLIIKESCNTAP